MDRVILHSDLNNFFASVECILNPALKDFPVAVCGAPEKRHGIVLAKNQVAKAYGVKTAETILEAKKKCPNLVIILPHHHKYDQYSKLIRSIYYRFTDKVEAFGMDECWLDVTESKALLGSGEEIAQKIRKTIKEETGLTVSIGVSFTKTFAKLGSDMKKPDAVTVISKENYQNLVWKLPIQELMFVGHSTLKILNKLNVKTIGDLANTPNQLLEMNLGVNGIKLKNAAMGQDNEPVATYQVREKPKSVGHGTTTYKDMEDEHLIKTVIYSLADMVAIRLRKYGLNANGVAISIKDNELSFFTRQRALISSTQSASVIAQHCFDLFLEHYDLKKMPPVRALTVSTYNLTEEKIATQISMFDEAKKLDKQEKLEKTMDNIREKFGNQSITRAAFLKNGYVLDLYEGDDESLPFYHQ